MSRIRPDAPPADASAPLRLRVADADDLAVASALLQDALVPLSDMRFLAAERRFVMVVNRFRWEGGDAAAAPERVLTGVCFDRVATVRTRGVDRHDRGAFLNLLSLTLDAAAPAAAPAVEIALAGDRATRPAIRVTTTGLALTVADIGDSWPTAWRPAHAD